MELSQFRCRKKENANLYAQHKEREAYGKIIPGETVLFYRSGLSLYAIPYTRVVRWWRRVEEVSSKVGCCSNDFSVHKLVLLLDDGSQLMLKIGEGLYRKEPERLMECLSSVCPEIPVGKPE